MQVDDPPYLSVGTAVSAKYKGAFCEAKVSKVVRIVKCKVNYRMGLGTATVSDEQIKGTLRVGQTVQAKHPEKKDFVEATITKIQDCSQYTVVFDDGDITTLRRTALCLKSGRHFNESETLDQLPLTHPEHFGNPVVGGRRGRRNRHFKSANTSREDSSDGEPEEENEPDLEGYTADIGRVVSVETTDKKRGKDNWFPGLVVIPSAQPTVRINVKDEYLIRSFKDGRYYTVPKKEVSDFSRENGEKAEGSLLAEAVSKALKYMDNNELPVHWERNSLFNLQSMDSDSDENFTDSSDDEPCEEKDRFVAQLYKFMDDAGTPLNKSPTIGSKDVDLYRLFSIVHKLGGYNKVTNLNKWRSITQRMKFPNNQNTINQMKGVYKKFLMSYESFNRTLGVTMLNHTRSTKKNKGRSLIRDKDRVVTPVDTPKSEKEDELSDKKEDDKSGTEEKEKPKRRLELRREIKVESDTNSSDTAEQSDNTSMPSTSKETGRSKRIEARMIKEKKVVKPHSTVGEKVKALVEKFEEQTKKEKVVIEKEKEIKEEEKPLEKPQSQTRSKSLVPKPVAVVPPPPPPEKKPEKPKEKEIPQFTPKTTAMKPKKPEEGERKRGRKRTITTEERTSSDSSVATEAGISVGDKLKVYYGPTNESKVTYEAKVVEIDRDSSGPIFLVHYTGWNTRYDEWIRPSRIAENISTTAKVKRYKQAALNKTTPSTSTGPAKIGPKRGRGASLTGRSTTTPAPLDVPRSTTPSSTTSTSSRTKSPATPAATRSSNRVPRQDYTGKRTRRVSAQTDNSVHSESDSDASESESESVKTRAGSKNDDSDSKPITTYRRKTMRIIKKSAKIKEKDDEDTEKEEEQVKERPKRTRKMIKPSAKTLEESDDDTNSLPKGLDIDLNQIRLELKGMTKPAPSTVDAQDKDSLSSDDSTSNAPLASPKEVEEPEEEIKEKTPPPGPSTAPVAVSPTSEDIYEFKEPEPFEFESRSKLGDVKNKKLPRFFEEIDKSPKRKPPKSPIKPEVKEEPVKKILPRPSPPVRKIEEPDEVHDKKDDPFDKLVESPSFNVGKTPEKQPEPEPIKVAETISLFGELPDSNDDTSRDMELSDTESQTQPIFSRGNEVFSEIFVPKPAPPEQCILDQADSKQSQKDSSDDDSIRASIQRVIAQASSTDDDSNDLIVTPSIVSYSSKRKDSISLPSKPTTTLLGVVTEAFVKEEPKVVGVKPEQGFTAKEEPKSVFGILKHITSPLLEAKPEPIQPMCSKPTTSTNVEDSKIVPKIADSLLQKITSFKSKIDVKPTKHETVEPEPKDIKVETKVETKIETVKPIPKPKEVLVEVKKPVVVVEEKQKTPEPPPKIIRNEPLPESGKKRRKVISRAFIESDSDSSDSENLIIARSDEDTQSNSLGKPHAKESESSTAEQATDDSQEERNFKFDSNQTADAPKSEEIKEPTPSTTEEKNEEPDSHLHSLLLCEETIPRSPAPATEAQQVVEEPSPKPRSKSAMEMPFASVPGSSNNKSVLIDAAEVEESASSPKPVVKVQQSPPAAVIPPLDVNRAVAVAAASSTVLDNTPPTTPESTISNLSPTGDNGGLSPATGDNESVKSNDIENDYPQPRSTPKISPYSEEDTLMTCETSQGKKDTTAAPLRKRRKSNKGPEEVSPSPAKRGRKPLNRSRHNSDSDSTSEHSYVSTNLASYDRSNRSPRPLKYNFFVELDPELPSSKRIAVLQDKLSELRKTYADVKSELAAVERRRKKIRKREREVLKAAKQELACA